MREDRERIEALARAHLELARAEQWLADIKIAAWTAALQPDGGISPQRVREMADAAEAVQAAKAELKRVLERVA